eukprot:3941985-Rhodomonas_salina.5
MCGGEAARGHALRGNRGRIHVIEQVRRAFKSRGGAPRYAPTAMLPICSYRCGPTNISLPLFTYPSKPTFICGCCYAPTAKTQPL